MHAAACRAVALFEPETNRLSSGLYGVIWDSYSRASRLDLNSFDHSSCIFFGLVGLLQPPSLNKLDPNGLQFCTPGVLFIMRWASLPFKNPMDWAGNLIGVLLGSRIWISGPSAQKYGWFPSPEPWIWGRRPKTAILHFGPLVRSGCSMLTSTGMGLLTRQILMPCLISQFRRLRTNPRVKPRVLITCIALCMTSGPRRWLCQIWSPNMNPNWLISYHKDTQDMDPQLVETAISCKGFDFRRSGLRRPSQSPNGGNFWGASLEVGC